MALWIDINYKLPDYENIPDDHSHLWYRFNGNDEEAYGVNIFCKLLIEDEFHYEMCFYGFGTRLFTANNIDVTEYVQKWTLLPQKDN